MVDQTQIKKSKNKIENPKKEEDLENLLDSIDQRVGSLLLRATNVESKIDDIEQKKGLSLIKESPKKNKNKSFNLNENDNNKNNYEEINNLLQTILSEIKIIRKDQIDIKKKIEKIEFTLEENL